ncbi:hypothetical protein L210DRAFT_3535355, partial [Boletus edulis BED1]
MLAVTALAGAGRLALARFGARAARLVNGDGDDSLHDDCVNEDDRSCLDVSRLEMNGFPGQRSGTLIPLVDSNLLLFAIIPQRVIFSSFTFAPTPLLVPSNESSVNQNRIELLQELDVHDCLFL